ncbi:MAG: hypothetical protein ABIR56_07620 [Polaromonas sp.]
MEPITTAIIAAIAAGALKSAGQVAEHLVGDGYAALKAFIVRKCGPQSEVVKAVDGVETRPDSEGRRRILHEEIVAAKLDQDAETLQIAQALLDRINAQPGGDQHVQNAVGSYIAQADRHSTAAVHVNQPKG